MVCLKMKLPYLVLLQGDAGVFRAFQLKEGMSLAPSVPVDILQRFDSTQLDQLLEAQASIGASGGIFNFTYTVLCVCVCEMQAAISMSHLGCLGICMVFASRYARYNVEDNINLAAETRTRRIWELTEQLTCHHF